MFIFPSVYEGFGIPILEAMAAQCPMLLSDIPIFREITQDQAIYFRHDNIEAIANAIECGLKSNTERERIVKYSNNRLGDFNFVILAEQLANLYKKINE